MGKVKRSRERWYSHHPIGVPPLPEAQLGEECQSTSVPVWEKLSGPVAFEREMACRTLSHVNLEDQLALQMISNGLAVKVLTLLSDPVMAVREAAAAALRNICRYDVNCCDHVIAEGIFPRLTEHLKECIQGMELLRSSVVTCEASSTSAQLAAAAEESMDLLRLLCEQTPVAVEAFNQCGLFNVLIYFLQHQHHPLSVVTAAAQCLHIVTEDNIPATGSLHAMPDGLALLETLLCCQIQPLLGASDVSRGLGLLLKSSIAGVLYNLLPLLPDPSSANVLRQVISSLAGVLEVDCKDVLLQLSMTALPEATTVEVEECSKTELIDTQRNIVPEQRVLTSVLERRVLTSGTLALASSDTILLTTQQEGAQLSSIQTLLSAQQLALELIMNLCYVDDDDDDDDSQWEDVEVIGGGDGVMEMEGNKTHHPHLLSSLIELQLLQKVWKVCSSVDKNLYKICETLVSGGEIAVMLRTLQERSLCALQNLLSILPDESFGGKEDLMVMWHLLLNCEFQDLVKSSAVVGVLRVLLEKLNDTVPNVVSHDDLKTLSQLGVDSLDPDVRSTTMNLFGTVGKIALKNANQFVDLLNVVGTALRDCVINDPDLRVVCHALDAIFDIFGDDNCSAHLSEALGLPLALQKIASTFRSRVTQQKEELKPHLQLIKAVHANLPAFIDYMESKSCKI